MKFLKQSIITRLGTAMFAISLMALISMISSVIVAESTQGDAAGINLAGSLRMMSYRIIAETLQHAGEGSEASRTKVLNSIDEFDRRIGDPVLTNVLPKDDQQQLRQAYNALIDEWRDNFQPALKAAILNDRPDHSAYLRQLENFVPRIDQMVQLLEESTESKIKLLSLIQGISLFMTVLIIFIAMYDIKSNVVEPLAQLLGVARDAGQGKFDTRVHYSSDDELGLLGTTFNHMAEELSKIYSDLEQRVQRKTTALRESNKSLQLLYNATRRFNRDEDICRRLMPIMKELEDVLTVGPIEVTLCDPHQRRSYRQLTTQLLERPTDCKTTSCNDCIVPTQDSRVRNTLTLPIQTREAYFGEFKVDYLPTQPLNREHRSLIEALVENLAVVLSLELKATQEQQMSLMEERTVIARELHDSLAQSLSYLKMQVGRLQILRKQQRDETHIDETHIDETRIDEVVGELKEGLNNAYRQLRELLTTFRLTLDQPGLQPALESTVKEFSERLGFDIPLKYTLNHQSLTANEEIHVLQLVREALANVVKHSRADDVSVRAQQQGERVEVCVEDNGVGLPPALESQGHYGLLIMRDRTRTLNGELSVENRESGGTRVLMTFQPKHS